MYLILFRRKIGKDIELNKKKERAKLSIIYGWD